jgi:hypothetical protein
MYSLEIILPHSLLYSFRQCIVNSACGRHESRDATNDSRAMQGCEEVTDCQPTRASCGRRDEFVRQRYLTQTTARPGGISPRLRQEYPRPSTSSWPLDCE